MKVYVVESGAYEERHINDIYSTREAAERAIIVHARATWEPDPGWSVGIGHGRPFPDPIGRSFDDWHAEADRLTWDGVGDVTEYDVLDGPAWATRDEWLALNPDYHRVSPSESPRSRTAQDEVAG